MKKKRAAAGKIKKANNLLFRFFRFFIAPFLRLKLNAKFDRKTSKGIRRPCLILCNHEVVFDIFVIGTGFNFAMNFVASDSLFRHGFASSLMKTLARPIPYAKGRSDSASMRQILSVIHDGGAVALFPSGNRSFFGEESKIDPSIGKLAKKVGVPLVLCRLKGGFLSKARWNHKAARGKVRAGVERVIQPDELAAMSINEINAAILEVLHHNEYEWNKTAQVEFRGKHKAEYLEDELFWCPSCGDMYSLRSHGNDFFCDACGAQVSINKTGFFEKRENADKLPESILDWGRAQLEFVKGFDFSPFTDKPVFSDDGVTLSLVERAKKQTPIGHGRIELFADKLVICGKVIPVTEIRDMSMHGSLRYTIYTDENTYCVDAPYRLNLFKYMICGYKLRNAALNITEENYGY